MIVGRVICQLPRIELLTQVLRRKLSVGDLYALGGRGSGNNEKKKKLLWKIRRNQNDSELRQVQRCVADTIYVVVVFSLLIEWDGGDVDLYLD